MPTKNIVPRADKEGGLGRSNKRWSEINAYTGSFIGELSSSVIQTDNNTTSSFGNIYIDGVSTPLFSDFSSSIASRVVSIEGGGITAVTAGTGISGGGSSGDVTVNVDFTDSTFKSNISGSFTPISSSLASRVTTLEGTDMDDDLGIAGDSGTGTINLDAQSLTIAGGTGITTSAANQTITITSNDGEIAHDSLSGFVANEHVDHSTVSITAGDGLTGGGDLTSTRTLAVQVDDSSIEINSDTLRVKASGITNDMLGGSIADSKLNTISTAGKVSIDALDIDGGTAIGEAVADADLFITDNGAGGTNRKVTASALKTYMAGQSGGSTLGNVQVGVTATGEIDTSSGNLTLDSADGTITMDDNVVISGNLTVSGTETKINSTTLEVGDRIVELNAGANDGGLFVKESSGGNATGSLLYDVSENRWVAGTVGSTANLVTISSTDTLTNKSIDASANTLTNIPNSALTNDGITLTQGAGMASLGNVDLGSSITVGVDGVLEDLDTLGAPASDGQFIVATGEGTFAYESGATVRTSLGVDAAGTDNSTNVTLANTNYLSISGQTLTGGTVPIGSGGTGATSAGDARTNLGVDAAGTDNSTDVTLVTTSHDYLSISGQAITLNAIDIGDDTNLTGGTGLALSGDTLSVDFTDSTFKSNISGSFTPLSSSLAGRIASIEVGGTDDDLTVVGDSGGNLTIDMDSETLTIAGGTGITTTGNTNTITIAGDDASTDSKGIAQFSSDNFAVSSGVVTIKDSGVILGTETTGDYVATAVAGDGINVSGDTGNVTFSVNSTSISGSFTSVSSSLAGRVATLEGTDMDDDLGIAGDSGTGTIDLDSQSLTIAGGTGVSTVASNQTVTISLAARLQDVAGLANTDGGVIVGNGSNFVLETGDTLRTSLGLAIGTNVQAYDAQLADVAGLAVTDGGFIVGDGSNFVLETGATARTSLGLTIGTDVQAYDAQLADVAGLAVTDGGFIVGDGSNFVLETAGTARTSLGLGSIATQASDAVDIDGGTIDGITSLTAGGDLDIGSHDFRAATLTADGLSSGRVVFAGTNGVLSDDSDLTFSGDTLTATKIGAFEAAGDINFNSQNMTNVDIDSGTIDGATIATSDITVGSSKTLDVSSGTLTTSTAQKLAIVEGVGGDTDIGSHDFRAQTLTADGLTSGRVVFAGTNGVLSDDADLTFSGATLTATTGSFGRIQATHISASKVSVDANSLEVGGQTINETDAQNLNNTSGVNTGDVTLSGTPDYITISNQVITRNEIDLTNDVTGTLPVGNGGTGATSLTDGGVLLGSGTSAITATAVLTNGQLLIGDNSGDPTVGTLTGTSNQITVTNGAGSITLSLPQSIDTSADVTFDSVTLDDLTASKLVGTNGDKKLVSIDLDNFVSGTSNQITVTDDTDGTITLSTPQNIHTGANPTFAGGTLGNVKVGVTADGEIDTSTGNLTIDSAGGTITLDDHVIISGNLTVSGTETKVNSTTLEVGDNIVELNAGANDGGLYVKETSGGAATGSLLYDVSANRWVAGTVGGGTTNIVGTSTTDTLTNKTIDADNNTISNLAHGSEVDNPTSGVHGVTGNVVGTSDTQTLTNKTISGASNTLSNIGNSSLTNNSVSVTAGDGLKNGGSVALGSSVTLDIDVSDFAGTGLSDEGSENLGIDASQTGITSILNTSLVVGRDADNQIKFGTDNTISFRVNGGDGVAFKASGEIEATSLDISGDADIDGTLETDALTIGGVSVEAGADVTDSTNVTAAGALMDSEVTSLSGIKTLTVPDSTTISTFGKSLVDDADAAAARTTLGVDASGTDNSTDVTLAGSLDYLTISGQTITRNAIDLTADVTGDLPVTEGGTGASSAADARSNLGITYANIGTVDISANTNLAASTGITLTGDTLTTNDGQIVHDNLSGFVANEHIDHSGVTLTAGNGLTGGGTIESSRTFAVGAGTGVTVNADDIAIGQDVATSADVQFSTLGLGTAPSTQLHVKNSGGIEVRLEADSDNSGQEDCFIRFYTDNKSQEGIAGMDNNNSSTLFSSNTENAMVFGTVSNLPTVFATNNTERMQIEADGDIKIEESLGIGVAPSSTTGRLDCSNDVIAFSSSDRRWKENIVRIENPLDKISKIGGYTFDWKELTEEEKRTQHGNEGHDVGVIAQEVKEVLPEVVKERDNGYLAVDYEKLVPLLIESIKELKEEIDDIKKKCDCLNK